MELLGDAASIRADVEYALETLGTDYIDVIVLCRVPNDVPIEETVTAMKTMVEEGKARHIGLSEANGDVLRRAHAVYPIYCIEQEWLIIKIYYEIYYDDCIVLFNQQIPWKVIYYILYFTSLLCV